MTPEEYLEKYFADAYKRELDKEENVVRSLPMFAAALAFVAASLGSVHGSLPKLACAPFPLTIWAILVLLLCCVGIAFVYLFKIVRFNAFHYVPREDEMATYARQLRDHYAAEGMQEGDEAVVADLRRHLIETLSKAVVNNRGVLHRKEIARGRAVQALSASIALTFVLVVATVLEKLI